MKKLMRLQLYFLLGCCFIFQAVTLPIKQVTSQPEHAIYLSSIIIDLAPATMQIRVKVFTDDLQNAIRNFAPERYEICSLETFGESLQQKESQNRKLVEAYFENHLLLERIEAEHTHTLQPHRCISIAEEGDVYILLFSIPLSQNVTQLQLTADYFMELFPTQTNVLQVSQAHQAKRFDRLTKAKKTTRFEL